SLAQDGHLGAQQLHVLQLVGDEDDRHPSGREHSEGREEFFLLRLADSRCRLVENQGLCAEPEEAKYFQLLSFTDRQRVDPGLRIQAEIELRGKLAELARRLAAIRKQRAAPTEDEIVQDPHRRKVEGVLVEYPHPLSERVRGGVDHYPGTVEDDVAGIRS